MTHLFPTTMPAPSIEDVAIQPRPYQRDALDALDAHLRTKQTNPCVVIPTGGGKSLVIAWALLAWKSDYPPFRCMVLAHRKELVEQNSAELRGLWPRGDIGVYSAGVGRRDVERSITYASIDSVWNKWGEFEPFDMILVDEAHRIPAKGEGKYRSFIAGCRSQSPHLRVAGFTATPYRLGVGPICHRDHILHEVCYEANVADLIRDGYLCKLRTKVGDYQPDLDAVRSNGRGDYVTKSLSQAVGVPELVRDTVADAVAIMRAEGRKSTVFFCVDVSHATAVSHALRVLGIEAPCVTGKTPKARRAEIAERFKAGHYRALVNVNVYTEGFNARRVDCVVLLRPTKSAGLYAQMVGRGLRTHADKVDCLVLDYARLIETLGPIDCVDAGRVRVIECGSVPWPALCSVCNEKQKPTADGMACKSGHDAEGVEYPNQGCGDTFSRVLRKCPHCGWEIPPQEVARVEAEEAAERKREMHERQASQASILGSEPETVPVDAVFVHRHSKPGVPDSLRVEYRCGLSTHREWVCLDHDGFAGQKARQWWARRFGVEAAKAITVNAALQELFLTANLAHLTEAITVVRRGKYTEITSHNLRSESPRS